MKQTILIVCALKAELDVIKKQLKDRKNASISYKFLLSGVGNYNTIFSLQKYLEKNSVHALVNIGVCGTKKTTENEILQVARIKNLANNREYICPLYKKVGKLISIASSEKVVLSSEDIEEDFVDMESFGIDFIASQYKVLYWILKAPFDVIGPESKQSTLEDIQKKLEDANFLQALEKIESYLKQNYIPLLNLEKYVQHFHFTFAEKEIFTKEFLRFSALKIDFKDFYKKNKCDPKEIFLKKMKESKN